MVYHNIKLIRKFKNITVGFAACELQVSVVNYIAIESGEVDLKLSKLFLIADILGVYPFDLLYPAAINAAEKEFSKVHDSGKIKDINYILFSDIVEGHK
jgi:transcriptional regulator with XRE-family HTH domain